MRLFVSPNDRKARCECENCSKLIDTDGSATSLVTNFANRVAEEVRKTYPKARIIFYAYDNYSTPPDHVRPGPGVSPEVVFWTWSGSFRANHAHPMFSDENDKYRRGFRGWAGISDGISAHTYYGHYNWFTPWPKITQMANDIPVLAAEPKCYGLYSESHRHWGTQGLNLYVHPKLMWNPKRDVTRLIDDYCRHAFGPAGPAIRQYFETLQTRMDGLGYINGNATEIPTLLSPKIIEACDRSILAARQFLHDMDASTRWRTNLVILAWQASAQYAEAVRRYNLPDGPEDRKRILALADEVDRFANSELGRWAFEHRVVTRAINVVRRGLGVPLGALPPGKHVFDDAFNYGGAIKFFAELSGLRRGMWGYSVPGKHEGIVKLPVRAAKGHRLIAVKLKWRFANTKDLAMKMVVVGKDGSEHTLVETGEATDEWITIPRAVLGGDEVTVRLSVRNRGDKAKIALTGTRLEATVE